MNRQETDTILILWLTLGLQRSRIFLYKSRMAPEFDPFRQTFFASIRDAAQLLRLFDLVPNVYLYVKENAINQPSPTRSAAPRCV